MSYLVYCLLLNFIFTSNLSITALFFFFSKEFAYASSDRMVYIRKFSTNGAKMTLVNTLQGHEGEVTCVRWNVHGKGSWVTGSEDGTIRIWVSNMEQCWSLSLIFLIKRTKIIDFCYICMVVKSPFYKKFS